MWKFWQKIKNSVKSDQSSQVRDTAGGEMPDPNQKNTNLNRSNVGSNIDKNEKPYLQ